MLVQPYLGDPTAAITSPSCRHTQALRLAPEDNRRKPKEKCVLQTADSAAGCLILLTPGIPAQTDNLNPSWYLYLYMCV